MSAIESRYAEALLSTIPSKETADRIDKILHDFSVLMSTHEELHYFLLNPVIKGDIKKETIQKILSEDAVPILVNFMFLLIDKGRFDVLSLISKEYNNLKNMWQKNLDIKVYSTEALDEQQLIKIREKYCNQYDALSATVHNYIEPSLLGGIRIKIGDTYIDDTVAGRLKGLLSSITI